MTHLALPSRRRWIGAFAASAAAPTFARAQAATAAAPHAAIATLLRQRLAHEGVGLVAAVIDGDTLVFAAAGEVVAGRGAAPDSGTLFEIGSISKTFTGLLLAEMVQRGELALDDAVEAVLPLRLRDSAGAPITFADLATHRSGLPRLPGNLKDASGADPYDYDEVAMFDFLRRFAPAQPRDQRFNYSNLGYGLLGVALGRRAGLPFADLLAQRVLRPLGLGSTRLALRGTVVAGLQPGHDAARRPVPNWRFDAIAGAGALVAPAADVARYAQAALGLVDHPLQAAFRLAMTPRAAGPSAINGIALGWLSATLNGRTVFNHDGGTAGFSTSLWLDPERRRAAFVLANAQVVVNDLALHLLDAGVPARDLAAEKAQTQRAAVPIDATRLAALAGRFALNPQFKVTIRAEGARLFAQATGQGEFEIFAAAPRRFFARITPLELHFEGDDGAPPAFVLHQGGQRLRFVRE